MAVLEQVITGLDRGRKEFSSIMEKIETGSLEREPEQDPGRSVLALGDNVEFMKIKV